MRPRPFARIVLVAATAIGAVTAAMLGACVGTDATDIVSDADVASVHAYLKKKYAL